MPSMNQSGRRLRAGRAPAGAPGTVGHVELEGVHQLVAEHVIGLGEGAGQRQHDAALQRFGDAAGALAELAADDVGLLEVRMATRRG